MSNVLSLSMTPLAQRGGARWWKGRKISRGVTSFPPSRFFVLLGGIEHRYENLVPCTFFQTPPVWDTFCIGSGVVCGLISDMDIGL